MLDLFRSKHGDNLYLGMASDLSGEMYIETGISGDIRDLLPRMVL